MWKDARLKSQKHNKYNILWFKIVYLIVKDLEFRETLILIYNNYWNNETWVNFEIIDVKELKSFLIKRYDVYGVEWHENGK